MSLLNVAGRVLRELRTSLENPSTPLSYPAEWLLDIFNGGRTDAGIRVSEMTALEVVTVYACVDLVSGAIGALPLHVYERMYDEATGRMSKRLAIEQDVYELLEDEPNEEMSSFDLRKTLQCHAMLWGNAYAEISRDGAGRIRALWPRNPAQTRPRRDTADGAIFYETSDGMPMEGSSSARPTRAIPKENMIHLKGLSLDGHLGRDVIQLARQAIGLSLAMEKFGAKFFGNGTVPGMVLQHPGTLSPKASENLRRSIQEALGGENMHRPFVLEEGMKVEPLGTEPEKAQMVQARDANVIEIARLFHVPPHMIGVVQTTTRATAEQVGTEFVNYTLAPWLAAWQQELRRKLMPRPPIGRGAGKRFVILFDTHSLTFPDGDARRSFYASAKQWGWMSTNDIRAMEHMNPIDDPSADEYWQPVNMIAAGSMPQVKPGRKEGEDKPEPGPDVGNRALDSYFRVFSDAIRRAALRRNNDFKGFTQALEPILLATSDLVLGAPDQVVVDSWMLDLHQRSTAWAGKPDPAAEWDRTLEFLRRNPPHAVQ